jgi:4-hydroxyphenylacetate 3-hydroxylase-like protein
VTLALGRVGGIGPPPPTRGAAAPSVMLRGAGLRRLSDDALVGGELRSAETRADVERYYPSSTTGANERIKLIKLIWDLIGTEYGGRQLQYEMFYSAAQAVVNRRVFGACDWASAGAMVERPLGEYWRRAGPVRPVEASGAVARRRRRYRR